MAIDAQMGVYACLATTFRFCVLQKEKGVLVCSHDCGGLTSYIHTYTHTNIQASIIYHTHMHWASRLEKLAHDIYLCICASIDSLTQ